MGVAGKSVSFEIRISLGHVKARLPLRALADVSICFDNEEITLRRCAVFERVGSPAWVSLARISVEKNGTKRCFPLIEISRDLKKRIFDAILDEYREKAQSSTKESSPGVSGQKCQQSRRGLRTGDGVRQETPGGPELPGPEVKAPLRN
jgi:hypothetical protein